MSKEKKIVITVPQKLTKDQRLEIKDRVEEIFGNDQVVVLDMGMEFQVVYWGED